MISVASALISIIVGFVVGVLSGLLGIGGGTMVIPLYRLGFAMSSIASTATSLFTIIFTAVSGTITHLRHRTCVPQLGIALGVGGACTSTLGVLLATLSPDWLIMVVAAVIIAYSAYTMLRKAFSTSGVSGRNVALPDKASESSSLTSGSDFAFVQKTTEGIAPRKKETDGNRNANVFSVNAKQLAGALLIGIGAGVASGYVGVGGGFIMVPLMMSFLRVPMKLASGTSLMAIMILSIPGVVYQGILGNVVWLAGLMVAVGTIPGAIVGARIQPRVPEKQLRILFAIVLFIAAIMLVLNEFEVLG